MDRILEEKESAALSRSSRRRGSRQSTQKERRDLAQGSLPLSRAGLAGIPEIDQHGDQQLPRDSADYIKTQVRSMKRLDKRAAELQNNADDRLKAKTGQNEPGSSIPLGKSRQTMGSE